MLGLFHKETEEEKRQKRLAKLGDRLVRSAAQGDGAEMRACLSEGASASHVDRYGFTPGRGGGGGRAGALLSGARRPGRRPPPGVPDPKTCPIRWST